MTEAQAYKRLAYLLPYANKNPVGRVIWFPFGTPENEMAQKRRNSDKAEEFRRLKRKWQGGLA